MAGLTPPCLRAAAGPAITRVLTNEILFDLITSCMDGVPHLILNFQRTIGDRALWNSYRVTEAPLFDLVIMVGNAKVLRALCELQRQPAYARLDKFTIVKPIRCAVETKNLARVKLVHDTMARYYKLEWEHDLLVVAARQRSLDITDWLCEHAPPESMHISASGVANIMENHYSIDALKWLCGHNCKFPKNVIDLAARRNNLDAARCLHAYKAGGCTPRVVYYAALHGNLDLATFLHENYTSECADSRAMDAAARKGYLSLLQFLHANRTEGCTSAAMDAAASSGHLEIVNFLHENREEGCTRNAMDYAAFHGHLEIVKFLHENRSEGCNSDAMDYAACGGHFEIAKFYTRTDRRDARSWRSAFALEVATSISFSFFIKIEAESVIRVQSIKRLPMDSLRSGKPSDPWSLPTFELLHQNARGRCTTEAMDRAAAAGSLAIVRFLHGARSEGCTKQAMYGAARHGHLEVVRFLHEHHSERCTTSAMDAAAEHGHLEVVEYLHVHRAEGCTRDAIDLAAKNGHMEAVRFLHGHRTEGCTTDAMDLAAEHGHLEVVRFLRRNRTEGCTIFAMDCAARNGHIDVVRFLHEHRDEGCTVDAMDTAAKMGHLVVTFLHEHRQEGCTARAMGGAACCEHAEVVELLGRNRSEGALTGTLTFVAANCDPHIVRALCLYSTRGCLHDARVVALQKQRTAVSDVLASLMCPSVESCLLFEHVGNGGSRGRCQRRC